MDLPVMPPVKPMLAKAVGWEKLPDAELTYEAKWDGFRCIVFRDGDEIVLGSRNERPLTRYFPEIVPPLLDALPDKAVVDGELIVAIDDKLEFDALQQRIHPAESRINMLADKTPSEFVAFDVLALGGDDLMEQPFSQRRQRLEDLSTSFGPMLHLTPATSDVATAKQWFVDFEGAGLDGLIAKTLDGTYQPNKRSQFKLKHVRTADVVVAGFRLHKSGDGVGSLLIGLHNDDGHLQHMGVATSFTAAQRVELHELLEQEIVPIDQHPWASWHQAEAHADGRMPGAPNRWSGGRSQSWAPLDCSRVAEVKYGSTLNGRFRATTKWLRWRADRTADSCDYSQLDEPTPLGVSSVLSSGAG